MQCAFCLHACWPNIYFVQKVPLTADRGRVLHVGKLVRYAFYRFPEAHDAAKCKLSNPI